MKMVDYHIVNQLDGTKTGVTEGSEHNITFGPVSSAVLVINGQENAQMNNIDEIIEAYEERYGKFEASYLEIISIIKNHEGIPKFEKTLLLTTLGTGHAFDKFEQRIDNIEQRIDNIEQKISNMEK